MNSPARRTTAAETRNQTLRTRPATALRKPPPCCDRYAVPACASRREAPHRPAPQRRWSHCRGLGRRDGHLDGCGWRCRGRGLDSRRCRSRHGAGAGWGADAGWTGRTLELSDPVLQGLQLAILQAQQALLLGQFLFQSLTVGHRARPPWAPEPAVPEAGSAGGTSCRRAGATAGAVAVAEAALSSAALRQAAVLPLHFRGGFPAGDCRGVAASGDAQDRASPEQVDVAGKGLRVGPVEGHHHLIERHVGIGPQTLGDCPQGFVGADGTVGGLARRDQR